MNDMRIADRTVETNGIRIKASTVQVFYGESQAIKDVSVDIPERRSPRLSAVGLRKIDLPAHAEPDE